MHPYSKSLRSSSRNLRRNTTDAEILLWSRLRRKQVLNTQLYRQKPLLNYVVDFYCAAAKVVIEIDGSQHYSAEGRQADKIRDAALNKLGLAVLRFNNLQVLQETEAVMDEIYRAVQQRIQP